MIKNSVIALVTAALVAGSVAPAMAAPYVPEEPAAVSFDADRTLVLLKQEGVNATRVETWGDVLRAFVVDTSGQQVMQYFDPDTLAPVNL